jgi:hypothetical protein
VIDPIFNFRRPVGSFEKLAFTYLLTLSTI